MAVRYRSFSEFATPPRIDAVGTALELFGSNSFVAGTYACPIDVHGSMAQFNGLAWSGFLGVFPTLASLTAIPTTYIGLSCTAVVVVDGIANTYMPSGGQFVIRHYKQLSDGTLEMSGPIKAPEFVTATTPVPVTMTGAQLAAAMVAGEHIQLGPGHHTITGQASVVSPTSGFSLTGAGKDKTFLHFDTGAAISIYEAATDWSISDLTLVSDVVSSVLTYLGIITTWSVVDNWKIERVGFTSPNNNENAIKMMTSSGGHGAAPFAFYVNETATGSVAQGYGNRFKTTEVTNDAGRITTTGLVGTLLGYGI